MMRLLTKITKRGPTAYTVLKELCWHEFQEAFKILDPRYVNLGMEGQAGQGVPPHLSRPPPHNHVPTTATTMTTATSTSLLPPHVPREPLELKPFEGEVFPDPQLPAFVLSNRIQLHPKVTSYHMRSRNRGVLFFVNIINFPETNSHRRGADMDRNNLIWVFRQMGFVIFYYEDLTYREMDTLLNRLIDSDYLRKTDCLVFSLMTHGSYEDGKENVQFTDGGYANIKAIIAKFHNDNCVRMRGRPKVLILPYCR